MPKGTDHCNPKLAEIDRFLCSSATLDGFGTVKYAVNVRLGSLGQKARRALMRSRPPAIARVLPSGASTDAVA
jgi:hypothetical protein